MKAAVVGSGAWGTALALCLQKNGHDVTLWCHNSQKAEKISKNRKNPRLPGVSLPETLKISADPRCVADCDLVIISSPSFAVREVCEKIALYLPAKAVMVSATKGIEPDTKLRMSQIVQSVTDRPVVVLTGPSHAEEVAAGIPTGCLAASPNRELAGMVQDAFMSDTFRIYTSPDDLGAELGGALKNIIALCAGVTDGLGYGDNIKAMLMTRGLTEMARLGVSLGAEKDTFAGLAGVGDLIVTCTSQHSRNRAAGVLIGQGYSAEEAMEKVGAVVEGYYAARSAYELSLQQGVDMPIVRAAYDVLYGNKTPSQVMEILMNRSRKAESEVAGWL
ncbi:MAG: NAD(P)-dependent glycerol-3-phosphate dehydrogenase [Ruminococcaceae bacterium]|nr:NAD(P)-dependent glycerol-3-phosphate dehydrogenase [Oscillospiraceae bacterium]